MAGKTDTETEVVPETPGAAAPVDTSEITGGALQAILDDHATYRAVRDCLWLDLIAYREGQAVAASHPGCARWLADGDIAKVA